MKKLAKHSKNAQECTTKRLQRIAENKRPRQAVAPKKYL